MEKITIYVDDLSKIGDGFHSMEELYQHRSSLFINLCNLLPDKAVYKHVGDEDYFLLYLELPTGQISYHLKIDYLKYLHKDIKEDNNHKWDKHTQYDVIKRLLHIPNLLNGIKN